MNIYDIVAVNVQSSVIASRFHSALLEELERGAHEYTNLQANHIGRNGEPREINFERMRNTIDGWGMPHNELRSSQALLRLYCNRPSGWIYGEVEQFVP